MIRDAYRANPIDAKFTRTAVCPVLSVDADHNLQMNWPEELELSKVGLRQRQRDAIPDWLVEWGRGKITVPPNPLCIDMSTVRSIFH